MAATSGFARANSSTRSPSAMSPAARSNAADPSAARMSGAPSTHVPSPSNVAPAHFRADVNGTLSTASHPGSATPRPARCSLTARVVAFGLSSNPPSAAKIGRTATSSTSSSSATSRTCILFSVSAPVLSTHTTLTRASPSIAGNSLVSTRRRPNRTMPMANAMDVISTRPSGTIGTSDATIANSASRNGCPNRNNCVQITSTPVGIRTHVITRRILLMPPAAAPNPSA